MFERVQHVLSGIRPAFPGRGASICLAAILIAALSLTPLFDRAPTLTLALFAAWLIKRPWALLIFVAFAILHGQWAGGFQALTAACVFLVAHGLRRWVRQFCDATVLASCIALPIVIIAGWAPLEEMLRWTASFALGAAMADLAAAAAAHGKRTLPSGVTANVLPIAALAAIINIMTIAILDIVVSPLARSADTNLPFTLGFVGDRLTLPAFLILAFLLQLYSRRLSRALEEKAGDALTGLPQTSDEPGREAAPSMALAQRARHADLGARIMTIAHELRQPLFTIAVAAESQRLMLARAAETRPSTDQLAERTECIAEQVSRATAIIEQILDYGRTNAKAASELDVAESLRRSCAFLAPTFEEQAIELVFSIENGWHCTIMSPVELEQVFVNALQNATDSIISRRRAGWTGTGRITCSVASCDGLISCIIEDNGAGVSKRHAEAAFDAFFSTKADEGTGLGLFITREIVLRAGGSVSLRPSPGKGAHLAIELPAANTAAQMSSRASRIAN